MKPSRRRALQAIVLAGALAAGACGRAGEDSDMAATPAPPVQDSHCDRACLINVTDRYLAAMALRDPSAAPLDDALVIVENLRPIGLNDGLWASVSAAPDAFAIHVPDPITQQAGFIGVLRRDGANGPENALLGLRLKLEGGRIVEAEHLVLPADNPAYSVNLQTPRPAFFAEIPADRRLPHDELIRIGLTYYDALEQDDADLTVFADDCERHENGIVTARSSPHGAADTSATLTPLPIARDCYNQMESGVFQSIETIDHRRVFAADPVTGLVMGLSHFRHPLHNLPYQVTALSGETFERNHENIGFDPFDMPAAHIFRIGPDGLMHEIEAVGVGAPNNATTGWEEQSAP